MTMLRQMLVLGTIFALLVTCGVLVAKNRELEQARIASTHTLAHQLHTSWRRAGDDLDNALYHLTKAEPSPPRAIGALERVEQALREADTVGALYSLALNYGQTNRVVTFRLNDLHGFYAGEVAMLSEELRKKTTLTPAEHQSLALMRADLALLETHLPVGVLADADFDAIDATSLADIAPQLHHPSGQDLYGPEK